jgi:NAD(P)-dependent dehydrogenase (short-subunit alcohol dehydrogenase family)
MASLVTGAASGLGAATAKVFAENDVEVFGLDLPASIERGEAPPPGVTLLPADVTSEADVQAAIDEIATAERHLRIVVNCAGVGWAGRILAKSGPHDLEMFRSVITINLLGTFNVMRLAANHMQHLPPLDKVGQRGVVINTASVAAFEGARYDGGRGARSGPGRHSRQHHRPGHRRHPDDGGDHPRVPSRPRS